MSDGLLRVFWPYDLPRSSSPGVIVGWRNSELDLFVLTVLGDVEVGGLNEAVRSARQTLTTATAAQSRQCPSRGDPLQKQPASHCSHLYPLRTISDACSRLGESTLAPVVVQSLPPLCEHASAVEGSADILSTGGKSVSAGYHVPSSAPDAHGVHVPGSDFPRFRR